MKWRVFCRMPQCVRLSEWLDLADWTGNEQTYFRFALVGEELACVALAGPEDGRWAGLGLDATCGWAGDADALAAGVVEDVGDEMDCAMMSGCTNGAATARMAKNNIQFCMTLLRASNASIMARSMWRRTTSHTWMYLASVISPGAVECVSSDM